MQPNMKPEESYLQVQQMWTLPTLGIICLYFASMLFSYVVNYLHENVGVLLKCQRGMQPAFHKISIHTSPIPGRLMEFSPVMLYLGSCHICLRSEFEFSIVTRLDDICHGYFGEPYKHIMHACKKRCAQIQLGPMCMPYASDCSSFCLAAFALLGARQGLQTSVMCKNIASLVPIYKIRVSRFCGSRHFSSVVFYLLQYGLDLGKVSF